ILRYWVYTRCRHVLAQVPHADSRSINGQPPQRAEIHGPAHGASENRVANERPGQGDAFTLLPRPFAGHVLRPALPGGADGAGVAFAGSGISPLDRENPRIVWPGGGRSSARFQKMGAIMATRQE